MSPAASSATAPRRSSALSEHAGFLQSITRALRRYGAQNYAPDHSLSVDEESRRRAEDAINPLHAAIEIESDGKKEIGGVTGVTACADISAACGQEQTECELDRNDRDSSCELCFHSNHFYPVLRNLLLRCE